MAVVAITRRDYTAQQLRDAAKRTDDADHAGIGIGAGISVRANARQ